jgi:hypothetical protein
MRAGAGFAHIFTAVIVRHHLFLFRAGPGCCFVRGGGRTGCIFTALLTGLAVLLMRAASVSRHAVLLSLLGRVERPFRYGVPQKNLGSPFFLMSQKERNIIAATRSRSRLTVKPTAPDCEARPRGFSGGIMRLRIAGARAFFVFLALLADAPRDIADIMTRFHLTSAANGCFSLASREFSPARRGDGPSGAEAVLPARLSNGTWRISE